MANEPPCDTHPDMERFLIEGYRRMSSTQKWERVASLNRALDQLAISRIKAHYGPDIPEREVQLRLAALSLGRDLMIEVFGWDPEQQGW